MMLIHRTESHVAGPANASKFQIDSPLPRWKPELRQLYYWDHCKAERHPHIPDFRR